MAEEFHNVSLSSRASCWGRAQLSGDSSRKLRRRGGQKCWSTPKVFDLLGGLGWDFDERGKIGDDNRHRSADLLFFPCFSNMCVPFVIAESSLLCPHEPC